MLSTAGHHRQREAEQATDDLFSYETTRAIVRERDRTPLEGSLAGDGYHVIVEILTETAARARVLTARFDLRRPRGGDSIRGESSRLPG